MSRIFIVANAILFLSLSISAPAFAQTSWEYLVKTYPLMGDDQALSQALNAQGSNQWELVNCTEGDAQLTCIFKRPIEQ